MIKRSLKALAVAAIFAALLPFAAHAESGKSVVTTERVRAELMAQAPEGAIGVKLSTPRRGCSGLG